MDIESAVKNLESFVELTEKSGDFREQQRACSAIGEMLNTLVCFTINYPLINVLTANFRHAMTNLHDGLVTV
jgi:hypothetical protein